MLHTGVGRYRRGRGPPWNHRQALRSRATGPCNGPQVGWGRVAGRSGPEVHVVAQGSRVQERTAGGGECGVGPTHRVCLLHAAAQHLVGRDEHDADDEGDGEGADQALAHTRLADLLVGAGCGRPPGSTRERQTGTAKRGIRSRLHCPHVGSSHRDTRCGAGKEAPSHSLQSPGPPPPPAPSSWPAPGWGEVWGPVTHSPRPQGTPQRCPGDFPPPS